MLRRYYAAVMLVLVAAFLVTASDMYLLCGDADGSGQVNVADLTYLVGHLFRDGPPPVEQQAGDCNGDGTIGPPDLALLVGYLFMGSATPCGGPYGTVVEHSKCKRFTLAADSTPGNLDCLEYRWDGCGVLALRHINTVFNCCACSLRADFVIERGLITITERESCGRCFCICLYDLGLQIVGLPPGVYTVRVNQLYLHPGDDILEFSVDLRAPTTGSYCVRRDHGPWGP